MTSTKWQFKPRFRKHSFGWKSQPAIKRIKEAISEIKKVARKDLLLAAEGAVSFLERLSPAIEQVDGSSGAIGTAVNRAIESLVPIVSEAPADTKTRKKWLERLWKAYEADQIPYLESLGDYWGDLCASKELASDWADDLISAVMVSSRSKFGYFKGTTACLSSLYKAERYEELLELLSLEQLKMWHYQQFAVKALAATGRNAEAIRRAEASRDQWTRDIDIASICESILLSSGFAEEAYHRYAFEANLGTTNLATFRAIAKKYSHKNPDEILADLIDSSPGTEGKWFATAKTLGFLKLAGELSKASPCDPRTLTRAARDFLETDPEFALTCGLSAIHWLLEGHGYEITSFEILQSYTATMQAADKLSKLDSVKSILREAVESKSSQNEVAKFIRQRIEIE